MFTFTEYTQLINEGFIFKDKTFYFDVNVNNIISSRFGKGKNKKPYESKLAFGKLYSVYKKSPTVDRETYLNFLSALKGQTKEYTVDPIAYDKFLTRTALYISRLIKSYSIDTILLMESSSPLLNNLYQKIKDYLPKYYDMFSYENGIFKNPNFDEISIDKERFGLDDKTVSNLSRDIAKAKRNKYFSIKKFPPSLRKVVINWLKLRDDILSKIVDKNVLVLDDVMTSGSTINEASRLLHDAGAQNIIGITAIKS